MKINNINYTNTPKAVIPMEE